jgi:hypothetical protein
MNRASRTKIRYRQLHPGKRKHVKLVSRTAHSQLNINSPPSVPSLEYLPDAKPEVNAAVLLDNLEKNSTSPLQTDQWLEYGGELVHPTVEIKCDSPPPPPAPPPAGMVPLPPEEIDPSDDCISYAEWQHLSTSPLYEGTTMNALEGILLTHQFLIHANLNKSTSEELLKLLSLLLPASSLLPPSYYKLMKVQYNTNTATPHISIPSHYYNRYFTQITAQRTTIIVIIVGLYLSHHTKVINVQKITAKPNGLLV